MNFVKLTLNSLHVLIIMSVKILAMRYSYRVWPMAFNMQSVYTEHISYRGLLYIGPTIIINETFTNTNFVLYYNH